MKAVDFEYAKPSDYFCVVCRCSADVCQDPPHWLMSCYDERQSPFKLRMIRSGVIGGDAMNDEEKRSYDLHHPEHVGDFDD